MGEVRRLRAAPDRRGLTRAALPYLRPHLARMGWGVGLSLGASAAVALVPAAVGAVATAVLEGDTGLVTTVTLALLGLTLVHLAARFGGELLLGAAGERLVRTLRDLAAERLAGAPLRFVESHAAGEMVGRATAEIAELAVFVRRQVPALLASTGYLLIGGYVLVSRSWPLALALFAAFMPPALFVLHRFRVRSAGAWDAEADRQAKVAATFAESLEARETLQLAGAAAQWDRRYARDNDRLLDGIAQTTRALNTMTAIQASECLAVAGVILLGGVLLGGGPGEVGTVVVFVLSCRGMFDSFMELTRLVGGVQRTRVGLARVLDLLSATQPPPDISDPSPDPSDPSDPSPDPSGPSPAESEPPPGKSNLLPGISGHGGWGVERGLRVGEVAFAYVPGEDVLRGVTLAFPPGERAVVVGATGAGKSTLAKLMAGLYAPDRGTVRHDGADLAALGPDERRRRVALIPQDVQTVRGTIAANLALGTGAGRHDLARAVGLLGLDGWLKGLPDGLDTGTGARGALLSAGERQLIGLIRAMLLGPAVLILDEATADVDPATAALIEGALERQAGERTLIVIAHRRATIDRFDRRIELRGGHTPEETT
ncbi:ABC transporter ATP-binding protein [Nonomuraea sp. NPDC050790]|uniref:ABC transporter ATP-binding protein n=1 Tax=Nonomuraea sp. NPDC050790 TaxID=3364371 RepID=UPI0037B85DC2